MAKLTISLVDVTSTWDLRRFLDLLDELGFTEDHPLKIHAGSAHLSVSTDLTTITLADDLGQPKE